MGEHIPLQDYFPLTSYAQNFEDVILWRALKHISHGCYIDVGAQHPVVDSVSKAFYERGWRGINIEPVPAWAALLRQDRPDETVLEVAIGDHNGTLQFNIIPDTGLSTALDTYAQRHYSERGYAYETICVPCLTLDDALRELVSGKEVHWLKIDVEGMERPVLSGWNPATIRPWVIVVEATIPNSQVPDFAEWETFIDAGGYSFVYFDGLNRFYLSGEHSELKAAFLSPPNVFDRAELSGLSSASWCNRVNQMRAVAEERANLGQAQAQQAEERANLGQAQAQQAEERANLGQAQAQQAEERANLAQNDLLTLLNSRSWRITAPLREANATFRNVKSYIKGRLKTLIKRSAAFVQKGPWLKPIILAPLAPFPKVKARLRRAAGLPDPSAILIDQDLPVANDLTPLSSRAEKIYTILKHKIEKGGFQ
ncbi:FkbM family methyltransferase [Acidithiobacillus ferrooxidans]|uniref:FkbM family methyltransferase n=1 Tax=Acidithiobacillus ferrooxidans TaxID=920 RepID=UPI00214CAF92|nr:FkbM family methyltransferase [Acidithiobacillus ferrooxidans]MCR2831774.1 FkbM family methyltransferase [Acidithiobacillus ferrooxidans]